MPSPNNPVRKVLLLSPLCQGGKINTERLSNLPEVTQLAMPPKAQFPRQAGYLDLRTQIPTPTLKYHEVSKEETQQACPGLSGSLPLPAAQLGSLGLPPSSIQPLNSSTPPGKDQQKPSLFQQRWEAARPPGGWGSVGFRLRKIPAPWWAPLRALGGKGTGGRVAHPERGTECSLPMGTKAKPTGPRKDGGGVRLQSPKDIYPNFLRLQP